MSAKETQNGSFIHEGMFWLSVLHFIKINAIFTYKMLDSPFQESFAESESLLSVYLLSTDRRKYPHPTA